MKDLPACLLVVVMLAVAIVLLVGLWPAPAMEVTEPPTELNMETDGNGSPLTWWTSRDPATALLELDLRSYGFFGLRVRTLNAAGEVLEDHQSETIANHFQLVCSDPAHAVGWTPKETLPAWIEQVQITLYPWPEMRKAPSDRQGTTYTIRR